MTAIDRTAYPHPGVRLSREELGARYDLTETDLIFVHANARGDVGRLLLAVLLKARQDFAPIGLPFGSYARLILIDWQTEALERASRNVFTGPSLKASLKRMGLPHGGKVMELVREQVERLASCRFTFHLKVIGGRGAVANINIVDHIEYCETGTGNGTRRFVECVRLSETFYQQLQAHPVSVDKASVMAIRNSSMALDLYMWLAYRLHSLESEKAISWAALKGQFGGGVSAMRNFKPLFSENLQLALGVYRAANVVPTPSGILLRPSPPPVPQKRCAI